MLSLTFEQNFIEKRRISHYSKLLFSSVYLNKMTEDSISNLPSSGNDENKLNENLDEWVNRCREARDGHYKQAERLFFCNQTLGTLLIYCTIFTAIFSFVPQESLNSIALYQIPKQHIIIFLSSIAAIISGIVTQSRYGERAEIHRSVAAQYANLARNLEKTKLTLQFNPASPENIEERLNSLINSWNELSERSLLTPQKGMTSFFVIQAFYFFTFLSLFLLTSIDIYDTFIN